MLKRRVSLALALIAALALVAPARSQPVCLQWYCSESGIIWICGDHQQAQFCQVCPSDC